MSRADGVARPRRQTDLPEGAVWVEDGTIRLGRDGAALRNLEPVIDGRSQALLSAAYNRPLGATALASLRKAALISRHDQALANLHLAIARLDRAPDPLALSKRLASVDVPTSDSVSTDDLEAAVEGSDGDERLTASYNADQPRVPSGSGPESGRWTSDSSPGPGSASVPVQAAVAVAALTDTSPLFAADVGAATLSALSALFATVGAAAVLGVLFVPWQKSVSDAGVLPGTSGATYDYNHDEGRLRILDASGALLVTGRRDRAGIFYDVTTGVPFAREVAGALVFDGDAARERNVSDTEVRPRAFTDDDEPKLCPAPGPDQPGSEAASPRAKAYQEQISRMVNPQSPLKFGLAISLLNPVTGRIVHYDECDRRTGTMIEAKGPGFVGLISFDRGRENTQGQWLDQSLREVQASGQRDVVWYFAEQGPANYARDLFADERGGRERIVIRVVPAVMQ